MRFPNTASEPFSRWEYPVFVLVLAAALYLRAANLGEVPAWVDEAESAINALTILDHGYPVDHYLGLPIFENTLVRPWPESAEYEFKDISYSRKGIAIYHGWVPLYSIAASFWLTGINSDQIDPELRVRHSFEEMRRRTVAARAPAVFFSIVFLTGLFAAARIMYGRPAAWAALLIGSFSHMYIWYGRQARYYSATIALNVLVCLVVWLIARRGRWPEFLSGGLVFVLLFHTHLISFLAAGIMLGLTALVCIRRPGALAKFLSMGAIIAAGTVPWILATGFLGEASGIPMAWSLMEFPEGLLKPVWRRHNLGLPLYMGVGWLALILAFRTKLPKRIVEPVLNNREASVFLLIWLFVSYFSFTLLIPAASYFYFRLLLLIVAPGILLASMVLGALARAVWPRHSSVVAFGLVALFFLVWARFGLWVKPVERRTDYPLYEMVDYLSRKTFAPGTRLYATPNNHLSVTFYSGLPVQSIAPVRKTFLDSYPRDIYILECVGRYSSPLLTADQIWQAARECGHSISLKEAREWEKSLPRLIVARDSLDIVDQVEPSVTKLPAVFSVLAERQRELVRRNLADWIPDTSRHLMLQGFEVSNYSRFWPIFFYRFINPEQRSGKNFNFSDRIRSGSAVVLRSSWVVYHSKGADGRISLVVHPK